MTTKAISEPRTGGAARRPDRLFLAVVAAFVAVGAVAIVLTPSAAAPRHVAGWYVGTWRTTGQMVGVQQGQLVAQPQAPAGTVRVTDDTHGLRVSMIGFPGVPSTPVPAATNPLALAFSTPDAGQGAGQWEIVLASPTTAGLRFYDASTGSWSTDLLLTKP